MQGLAEELKCRRATGAAGGGMVEIEVNGAGEVLACRMEPPLVAGGDRELIEDLVVTAVNQALGKAKQLHAEAMQSLAGNLNVPGLDEAMGKLLGGGASGPVDE
ncbi:MAG: YbaB/EbfC family nucleoid-associated protein [Pirellulales bacterium]|nr:YbaB/EbfC family nucleoid-associated protein [Pirellulales bacterium]